MKLLLIVVAFFSIDSLTLAHDGTQEKLQKSVVQLESLELASDDEQKWVSHLVKNRTLNWSNEYASVVYRYWLSLADKAVATLSQPGDRENAAFSSLFLRLAFWAKGLPPSEVQQSVDFIAQQNFRTPGAVLLARSLQAVLKLIQKSPVVESDFVAHARLGLLQAKRFETTFYAGIDTVVKKNPSGNFELDEQAQVEWFESDGSGIRVLSSQDWVKRLFQDYKIDYLERWALGLSGDRQGRVRFLISQSSRFAEPSRKEDTHHSNPNASAAEQALHFLEHVGKTPQEREKIWDMRPENKPLFDNKISKRVSRQQALSDPFVQSVLDKCLSCHIMYNDSAMSGAFLKLEKQSDGSVRSTPRGPTATKYVTRAALSNALLIDPGPGLQGFQRKLNDMLGKNANVRHIHFSQFERDALERIINFTADDPKAVPFSEEQELLDRQRPSGTLSPVEASLYDDPALVAAQFRCVQCHRDPAVAIDGLNTFTGLRKAMLDSSVFTQETLTRMINYGYNNERLTHIKNLNEEPLNALSADLTILNQEGGVRMSAPLMMKDKLQEFIRLRDLEESAQMKLRR